MSNQEQWRQDLQSPDVGVRANAAEKLCTAGAEAANAAVELVKACGDDETVQNWAVAALEDHGPPPPASIGPLAELVTSPHSLVAYWAATLLSRIGPQAIESQSALAVVLLESPDEALRERAALALGKIGANSSAAVNALDQAANAKNVRLARLAKESLELVRK